MKIRNGFVSNSSSSSFCIYGAYLNCNKEVLAKLEDAGFYITAGPDDYYNTEKYVGIEWCDIDKNETGQQFMDRIERKISDIVGSPVKCGTHSAAWYNG